MRLVVLKYNSGNIQSVMFALERIGVQAELTDDKEKILTCDKLIFPGVGEASSAMKYLKERGIDRLIPELKQPTLGICLGLQLMCRYSEENDTECMGIFNTKVKRFEHDLKVPQIGWNKVNSEEGSPLFKNLQAEEYMYFVHSFYAGICDETIAITQYGVEFSSALKRNNFYGVQFHPEKSSNAGEMLLRNFLDL